MNKIQINVPEGFEIDNEKSNLSKGIIEFKPVEKKKLSYEDVAKELLDGKSGYFACSSGKIFGVPKFDLSHTHEPNNATSKEQLECLMAYNKLRNVAEYLNKRWQADWKNQYTEKYYIFYNWFCGKIKTNSAANAQRSEVYFASRELAEQAIEILGEEEIKKALFIY